MLIVLKHHCKLPGTFLICGSAHREAREKERLATIRRMKTDALLVSVAVFFGYLRQYSLTLTEEKIQ